MLDCIYIYIYRYYRPNSRESKFAYLLSWTEPCSVRVSVLQQNPGGEDEQVIVYFLTGRDSVGNDVCRFSLATNSSSIFTGVCCAVLRTWWTFYCRIACWNISLGKVAWESKYDIGRPEICKDPKNITDEAILRTLWVFDYNFNTFGIR